MSDDRRVPAHLGDLGPVSPELILVSPHEIAELARKRLPDVATSAQSHAHHHGEAMPMVPRNKALPDRTAYDVAGVRTWRRSGATNLVLAGAAVVTGAAGFGVGYAVHGTTATPPKARVVRGAVAVTSSGHAVPGQISSRAAAAQATTANRPASTRTVELGTFPPPRHLSWGDSERGRTYVARLFRNQRQVFEARLTKRNVTIPATVRFTSGLYEWRIDARRGGNGGAQLLVDWSFICKPPPRGTGCTTAACPRSARAVVVICRQV